MKDRNGRQHHLRAVTDSAVIERIKAGDLQAPIGGQHADGTWYVDTRLCGFGLAGVVEPLR